MTLAEGCVVGGVVLGALEERWGWEGVDWGWGGVGGWLGWWERWWWRGFVGQLVVGVIWVLGLWGTRRGVRWLRGWAGVGESTRASLAASTLLVVPAWPRRVCALRFILGR